MLPLDFIPYKIIGFAVFWMGLILVAYVGQLFARAYAIQYIKKTINWLWEGANPSEGETPSKWKHRASFYLNNFQSLLRLRQPSVWRWKTYKQKIESGDNE